MVNACLGTADVNWRQGLAGQALTSTCCTKLLNFWCVCEALDGVSGPSGTKRLGCYTVFGWMTLFLLKIIHIGKGVHSERATVSVCCAATGDTSTQTHLCLMYKALNLHPGNST